MGRVKRFNEAYNYIRYAGKVKNQTELAELMKSSRSNVSVALNGKEKILTNSFLIRFNEAVGRLFSLEWLLDGKGEMLSSLNSSVANSGVINVSGDMNTNCGTVNHTNDQEGDTIEEAEVVEDEFESAPIIPSVWAKRRDFDIAEAIEERGNELEQSRVAVAGTPIDAWYHIQDTCMSPYYLKGDKVALARTPTKKIVPGRVYGIDTVPHGLLVRVLYKTENGFIAHSYNNSEFPDFEIEMEDVSSIFSVVCLVRM